MRGNELQFRHNSEEAVVMSLTYQKRVKLALPSNEEDVAEYFQDLRKSC